MANTLTGLIPIIGQAADVVSRELVGFVAAAWRNASADMVAKGQTITYPVTPAMAAADITPAAAGPSPSDQTITPGTMTISKARGVTFYWEGEEQKALQSAGFYEALLRDQFAQAMRTLVNEVEADCALAYKSASRAFGTAGTTPFGSSLEDLAQVRKILADNGAPLGDLQLVINTAAGAKIRALGQLSKANEAGSPDTLRRGVLLDIYGFQIRESAAVVTHTKGTGSAYQLNGNHDVGSTTIALKTGTGTVLAGDIIAIANDPNRYVVNSPLSGGSMMIGAPGLLRASANNTAVTIGDNYAANLAFDRGAVHLVCRVPAMPAGGDAADDVTTITDPVSGLSFQVAMYRQYRRIAYEVGLAWGVKVVKPAHVAILLG